MNWMIFANGATITKDQVAAIVDPLIQVCNAVVPVLLAVVGAIGAIWCIFLGVKLAKASDPQEHEKAKNGLRNSIIGFVLIFVLLIGLRVGLNVFTNWYTEYIMNI